MQPSVATMAPGMPAMRTTTKVAELIAMGPGVIWAIVIRSVNSRRVSQGCSSTTWLWISGMAAYPPPTLNSPTCRKLTNSCR